MNTDTLPRPALRPLPAPRPGALVAAHHDPRPCVTNPIGWWDTGNPNNGRAKTLCRTTCPRLAACLTGDDKPRGVIRAGVAYDDNGKKARQCDKCYGVLSRETAPTTTVCDLCQRGRTGNHHSTIAEMRACGCSWSAIGRVIGRDGTGVRRYWEKYGDQGVAA